MAPETVRLLIVDDEPDTCSNLSDIFTDLGYRIDVAYDGESALELVKKNRYDVALLDLKMPGMDGLELYRRIRRISAETVAIVVTAYASGSTAASVLEAGAWKILPKPIDFPVLMKLVDEAMNQPLVLVVDDDRDLCDSLWDLFRERNYRVCLALDVPDAVQKLQQQNYHVVVVDLKLPSTDGTKVLDCLSETNPQVRSVVITGHRDEMQQLVERALTGGANAVCYKPFDVESLLTTVAKLCQKKVPS